MDRREFLKRVSVSAAGVAVGVYEPSIDLGHGVKVKFKITILDEEAPRE